MIGGGYIPHPILNIVDDCIIQTCSECGKTVSQSVPLHSEDAKGEEMGELDALQWLAHLGEHGIDVMNLNKEGQ